MLLEPEGPTVTTLLSPKAESDSGDRVGIVFMSKDSVPVICVNSGLSKPVGDTSSHRVVLDASNDEQGVDTGKVVLDSIVDASFR